jgi:hypothetical protein
MTPLARLVRTGLIAILLLLLTVPVSQAKILKSPSDRPDSEDLFLLGFGELTMHMLDVSGGDEATEAFESANPTLKADFSTNYRMSLFANGTATSDFLLDGALIVDSRIGDEYRTVDPSVWRLKMSVESTEPIWDTWRFTGHGVFDPARQWEVANLDKRLLYQPQEPSRLELLMRLESEQYGVIEGGSIRPSFKDAKFTLHQRSIFGAYADLHGESVGAELVAGKLEGKSFRETTQEGGEYGFRADGTSGPFELTNAPITRGSEEVKIQVRDRFDESTVLSTRTLVRDVDYNVDYLRASILLHRPVASETSSADPVYVVITYDYLREANDDIMGGRARAMSGENFTISGSYLHRNIDDEATGFGVDEPEDLVAGDASFKVDDHTTGYVEVAGSQNPDDDDDYTAARAGIKTNVIDGLTLNADFQRISDQFRSFTNSDLNPTKNQQRWDIGGDYQITESQKATASFGLRRGLEANGLFNRYDGIRDEKIYAAGYRNDLSTTFGFGARLEKREVEDRDNPNDESNYQNRIIVDVDGTLEDFLFFGKFGYAANYEQIRFRNDLDFGKHDANTNQMAVTLTSQPSENADFKIIQRFAARKDRVFDIYDERQDVTILNARYRPHENVNTFTTYEYKRYTTPGESLDLWQDDPNRIDRAATLAIEYLPLDKIKALAKFSRYDQNKATIDSTTRSINDHLLGQLTYFHTHHLSFSAESELRSRSTHSTVQSRDRDWDLGLRVNWNRDRLNEFTVGMLRRWQMFGQGAWNTTVTPAEQINTETKSVTYIALLSGSISLTERFFARGSIKGTLLNEPLDDEKTFARLELGYDSFSWYRFSVGYERIASDNLEDPERDYTGQGVFVRFSGKM